MKNTKDILVKEPALILLLSACLWAAFSFRNEKGWSNVYTKPYIFTSDTFADRIPFWTKDLEEFKGKPAIQFFEIGTFEGRSALWVLENILTDPASSLTVIDTFDGPYYKTFLHNVNLSGQSARFKILAGYSTEKIKEVPLHSIDFAYIDGSADGNIMFEDLKNA
ncbi:class I SAM-dependent methyltransferase [Candidatus Methylacidiphilum infernorum]|uniref:Class I SAM-dependent methyltransferase n=1 Tax=Candidatus Methylacidiphilum infernorum TaxID=511746 RepID=A0ABX7PUJ8_9BACT|nr:class I SAM-dependent methyltransferase [Candidatus Methylacidiphilum infernorum]QSR86261.1 class I SAM-dependent methyltransferase [Candidatus Methylacidiphilum infernorum]